MANYFNLDDRRAFPAWRDLPGLPEGGALFLTEIQQCDGFGRFRTIVKDFEGKECVVAFYPDSYSYEDTGFDFKKLKKGHTLAIFNAYQYEFLDETHGVRVEDMDDVSVIPAGLQVLRDLGPEEEKYGVDRPITEWRCHGCDATKPIDQMSRCGRCKIYAYCSKECQTKGWIERNHKTTCKVLLARYELPKYL